MKKRWIAAAAAALAAALCAFGLLRGAGRREEPLRGNLLRNGDFSAEEGGMPADWETGMWVSSPGASYLESAERDGKACVLIENAAENDARFEQTVQVRPGSMLRLSALAAAENCGDGMGANVSFLGYYGASADLRDSDGWERLELYASVGEDMREVTVCLRLGGYGSLNTGKCWFADAVLEEVENAPVGAPFVNLTTPEPQRAEADAQPAGPVPLLLASAAVWLALCFLLARRRPAGDSPVLLAALLAAAFALRLALAASVSGYGVDMGCFSAWAQRMAERGPAGFYETGYFCDYPPGYMLVLGLLGLIANLLKIPFGGMGMQVLLKLVPILADLGLAVLFWRALRGTGAAFAAAALIAANPALIVTGSCWGQIDAVTALLLLLVLRAASEGRWRRAIPLFALAVLTKPQAGLLAPLGLAALAKELREAGGARRARLREIGLGLLFGAAATAAAAIPFSLRQSDPFWLAERYLSTLSSYNYATLSTGNLLFLLGGNWRETGASLLGPVTYGGLGGALMAAAFAFGILTYWKGEGRKALFPAAAATLQLVFALGAKMHERYVVPALVLLLAAALETGDARLFASFALASAASAVNIGVVLAFEYLIAPNLALGYGIAVCQLAAAALTVWACVDLVLRRRPAMTLSRPAPEKTAEAPAESAPDLRAAVLAEDGKPAKATPAGLAALALLTALYAAVAFYDLGVTKAPETGYGFPSPSTAAVSQRAEPAPSKTMRT